MKNFNVTKIMKKSTLTKLLATFLAIPIFLFSCEKPETPVNPDDDTENVDPENPKDSTETSATTPTLEIKAGEASHNKLTFTISATNATHCGWKEYKQGEKIQDDIFIVQQGNKLEIGEDGSVSSQCEAIVEPDTEYAIVAAIQHKNGYLMDTLYMTTKSAPLPTISLDAELVAPTFIKFKVGTADATKCAWTYVKANEVEPTNEQILETGTPIAISDEPVSITASSLQPNIDYVILVAAQGKGGVSGKVLRTKTAVDSNTPAPTITLTEGTVEAHKLSFSITATNSLICYYLISYANENRPTMEEVFAKGKEVILSEAGTADINLFALAASTQHVISVAVAGNGGSTLADPLTLTTLEDPNAVSFSFNTGQWLIIDNPAEGEVYIKLWSSERNNKDDMILDFFCSDNKNGLLPGTYIINNTKLAGTLDSHYTQLHIYTGDQTIRFASGSAYVELSEDTYTITMDFVTSEDIHYIGTFNGKLPKKNQ